MTEQEIDLKEQEMRNLFPEFFNHPDTKEGEMVYAVYKDPDAVFSYVALLKSSCFPSARLSSLGILPMDLQKRFSLSGVDDALFAPLFVNIREYIVNEANRNYMD